MVLRTVTAAAVLRCATKVVGTEQYSVSTRSIVEPTTAQLTRKCASLEEVRCGDTSSAAARTQGKEGKGEADAHLTCHAPPATTLRHALQFQIPTQVRFIAFLPQNEHV
jgi:hypothetical protein